MSEQEKKVEKPVAGSSDDQELADLLDSALEDFSKEKPKDNSKTKEKPETVDPVTDVANLQSQEWSDDFIQQAASQFETNFARLLAGANPNEEVTPDLIQQKLQQMADAAQTVLTNPTEVSDTSVDFASTIKEAIQNLNTGAESAAQNSGFNEDDLMRVFGGQEGDMLPFMQGMMQGLLSKEVLGPSLQDFVDKLPPYLEKNKESLSEEDLARYTSQKEIMEQVLSELNKENDTDSMEIKKERFNKVLGLMQKLQEYGQPPTELVGDVEAPFNFDPATGNPVGLPNLDPSANPECCVM